MYTITQRVCLVLACIFVFSSCTKDTELPEDYSALKTAELVDFIAYSEIEIEILDAVNEYRRTQGLSFLERVDDITLLAEDHNRYMIENKIVNHDNFDKRYFTLVKELGAKAVSENIGFGYRTADAVVQAWIKSEGHKKNIEGDFSHFGISVEQDEEGKNYFTNIFVKK